MLRAIRYLYSMSFLRITELCRKLRKHQNYQEKLIWNTLKSRQFFGFKFRRQHPFIYEARMGKKEFFIADFYCAERNLIIELDGRIHDFQKDYDRGRDYVLAKLGLKTLRIENEELENDIESVLMKIKEMLL